MDSQGRRGRSSPVAAGPRHHRRGVFRRADVAVADHRDRNRVFHRGDLFPAGMAGVTLLARAGMQRHCVQTALFRQLASGTQTMLSSFQPRRIFTVRESSLPRAQLQKSSDQRQVTQQTGAAIARDDALGRAAEIQVDHVEARVLHDLCRLGRVPGSPEELRGDRVLVVVVGR